MKHKVTHKKVIELYIHASIMREKTLNGQVLVPYLIKYKQFEAGINLPTNRKFSCLSDCQVEGDMTIPIRLNSYWIKRQPPAKEDKLYNYFTKH